MMRVVAISASLCLVAGASAGGGTVAGRVQLLGKGGKQATDLSQVVVWVEGPKVRPQPSTARIDMRAKVFRPHLVVVPVGGTVEFPNLDAIFHNVFSVSPGNRFDLDLYKKPESRTWTPGAPGIVRVFCNIHPQMTAIVVVRDNPYWTMASSDGRFAMPDVPAGQWVVTAWHERSGESSRPAAVGAGEVSVELTLDASRYRRVPHKNKYGKDYDVLERY